MLVKGLPSKFWLVVSPSPVSTLGDICFECDLQHFAAQIRGGLDEQKIIAVFAEQQPAIELAERLLRAAEEPCKPLGVRIHRLPSPNDWYANQYSADELLVCNRQTVQQIVIKPPEEWGNQWDWNFTEDGSGIVIRQTA